jgi:bifunctional ADP-heptose synthase (sugar kinase/adenylyltransferase)
MVDYVVAFGGTTPAAVIRKVRPQVLVKGADWPRSRIVGRQVVEAAGGVVRTVPLRGGLSTSRILRRIVERFGK